MKTKLKVEAVKMKMNKAIIREHSRVTYTVSDYFR